MRPRRPGPAPTAAALACALAVVAAPSPGEPRPADAVLLAVVADPPTPPTPPTPPAPAPAPPAPAPRTATVVMGGDLLWHDTVWLSAQEDHARTGRGRRFDFGPMFASLAPLVRGADVALCHEEVPFAGPGQPLQSYPVFAAPPEVAPFLAELGFDACVTASNHALDQGYGGLVRTAGLLERHGIAHVGTFTSERARREPVVLTTAQGVRVGVVAGTYSLNGFPLPEGRPWSVSMWDAADLLRQAHRARRAGADIVVVNLHGGTEYDPLPDADQVALVERLAASPDVDLVLGEHAHVVQPVTRVLGTWVVYGMGNTVAQQEPDRPRTYEGITVRFTFAERPDGRFAVTRAAYVPTYWNRWAPGRPVRIQRVIDALAHGRGDLARLREARAEIRRAVHALGRAPGLVEE